MANSLATIDLVHVFDGNPGVKLNSTPEFDKLEPLEKVKFISAVSQLCAMAVSAICADNPDMEDEIIDLFTQVQLVPTVDRIN